MKETFFHFTSIRIICFLAFLSVAEVSFAQDPDSTKLLFRFGGSVTVTTKGISMVPNLSLGKPAAIFDLSAGRGKLSFEPSLRFALEGKPWSFLFWWRYRLVQTDKFRLIAGVHPALSFKTYSFTIDGTIEEHLVVRRYLAGELAPSYYVSQDFSIGLYLLYSYGIEKELTKNNTMLSIRGSFSDIRLSDQFSIRINPQVYYLNMDGIDGVYANASLTFVKKSIPVSLSVMVNQPFRTRIEAGNEFLWNISLIYSFSQGR